ncbi:MAG: glycosyltransferase family 25 protein [Ignavibacteria bacterium]|jgi:GR25 family glycosyltransferase involved in LPS biosynthesis|nr:glycosyltransferase family 25 protein [Ignavibacteria bacterium]
MNPNEYFDKIYCINLERRKDKWVQVQERFKRHQIEVERFEAIDKLGLEDEFNQFYAQNSHRTYIKTSGTYAILKTYIALYEHILSNPNINKVLIFEDDVLFYINFNNHFKNSVENIPSDWDIWYLGGSQYKTKLEEYNKYFNYAKNLDGCFAIALQRNIIKKLLNVLKLYILPSDSSILYNFQNDGYKVLVSSPHLNAHDYGYSDNWDYYFDKDTIEHKYWRKINTVLYR